ncbi:MAG: 4-alpha-glucanotransferase [Candidatus Cloacimonetes bacterium]|nr:4-alpha-glucanotransferase [Candidatus Cloacimonadota bacterium]MCF7812986.1 4-alpha-glucanotransferase [Candidatus Cloacimonadota bacterium]MCF7867282.1 4-alpha-glucanotransferase [Candidatus Cloacimonadota bacterium]MCF7882726.1 4-alpha-glucanotransferase [Candidatus Cloacimonadota bacterium]
MNFKERQSGALLHVTSLPNIQGIGTLGKEAFEFVDKLSRADQKIWQICPLGPTGYGDSPYQTFSAFAGNPLLLDMNDLVQKELLQLSDLESLENLSQENVDYGRLFIEKNKLLKKAYYSFQKDADYDKFCQQNEFWLHEYALFMAIKDHFGGKSWIDWPQDVKLRSSLEMEKFSINLVDEIDYYKFLQFIFWQQWSRLHDYARQNGIEIFGDIPIFVALDSADAWSNRHLFLFDENGNPTFVAGVPPDYFSVTGQLWGNPLYNWQKMQENDFAWWKQRFGHSLKMFDLIRVDHFRGFAGYWAVPFGEETAIKGSWQPALGEELFSVLNSTYGSMPIVAEDLGVITDDVIALKEKFGFPGMKILQFAFGGGDDNPYLPQNYEENCAAYTGTHDNDTTLGWFQKLSEEQKKQVCDYLSCRENEICKAMIEAIWQSKANIAVAPMQDWLELGNEARMNTPGKAAGNWQWRIKEEQFDEKLIESMRELTVEFER